MSSVVPLMGLVFCVGFVFGMLSNVETEDGDAAVRDGLVRWLVDMNLHVIQDSTLGLYRFVVLDVDGCVLARGRDFYDAIRIARISVDGERHVETVENADRANDVAGW